MKARFAPLALALATLAAYASSFRVPFIFDDLPAVRGNASLRHLGQLGKVLLPPPGLPTDGRPLLNLSLALNYAWTGTQVWSYHAVNLLIHGLAGLLLYGIVRRSLKWQLAAAIAALWMLHPVQTEAVTYVSQRAESLMGLFYLLTLYCFVRGVQPSFAPPGGGATAGEKAGGPRQGIWFALSAFACLFGMAIKEVMVTAPVLVLLYDRAFLSGSFREALAHRKAYYAALASSWLLLAFLLNHWALGPREVGFQAGMSAGGYMLAEVRAVADYLKLAVWPHPLVFDYGQETPPGNLLVSAGIVVAAIAATVWAWRKSKPIGFLCVSFFVLLAPTSSFVPVAAQPMAESRMYLALAPLIVLAVRVERMVPMRFSVGSARGVAQRIGTMRSTLFALGLLTFARNQNYHSSLSIWADTVAKRPESARAQSNLGMALLDAGRIPAAISHFHAALAIRPDYADAHDNLGDALARSGRVAEAIEQFSAALRLTPNNVQARKNLGYAFAQSGRNDEAMVQYREALALDPDSAETHYWLANALGNAGRYGEAIAEYDAALRLRPDFAEARQYRSLAIQRLAVP